MATKKRKNTNSRKRKSRNKSKSKVYIPASKIILLCTMVIIVSMILLFITSINPAAFSDLDKKEKNAPSITSRFIDPAKKEKSEKKENNQEEVSKSPSTKKETTKAKESPSSSSSKTDKPSPAKQEQVASKKSEKEISKPEEKKIEDTNASQTTKSAFDFPQAVNNAQLVFVFDDGGQNLNHLDKFLELPFPITVAVLPQLPYSKQSAEKVRAKNKELILHQPMQALNSNMNPGPGAITASMSQDEIQATLFQNLLEISPVAGMNNHEGSKITADIEKMETILKFASENGIYFLDSRTNVETKVPYVAGELGFSYYERNVFLDNEKTRENIISELKKGIAIANKNGVAIMIGHIWSADILPQILIEAYPELKSKGYTFKTVSNCNGRK